MARTEARTKPAASAAPPTVDVYVGLTVAAFLALAIAIGLLCMEIAKYKGF